MLHYPPDPDSHGYQAAPTTAAKNEAELGDDNDGASSSTSHSVESSSSSYFSDTDEVAGDDDSDRDIPKNYDNNKEDLSGTPFRRSSGASTFTGSLTSQASSSFNTRGNDAMRHRHRKRKEDARKKKHQKRKSRLHRLTRSETNPINPFHRKALSQAKYIEELERTRQNDAEAVTSTGLDDDENWLEDGIGHRPSRHNSRGQGSRRRSSMSDLRGGVAEDTEAGSVGGLRRGSQNSERPKKLKYGAEHLTGSAIYEENETVLSRTRKMSLSRHSISPSRNDPVVPPDIQTWSGLVSNGYGGPSSAGPNLGTSTSGGGSSGGGGSGAGTGRGSKVSENNGGLGDGHSHGSIQGSNKRPSGLTWETVLGFDSNFLSELLVPSRFLCNTRFELSVDDMVFLGAPVHVLPDGKWKKRKKPDLKVRSMPSTLQGHGNTSHLESSLATLTLGSNNAGPIASNLSDIADDYDIADDEYEGTGSGNREIPFTEADALYAMPPFPDLQDMRNGDSKNLFKHTPHEEGSDDSDLEVPVMEHSKDLDEDNTQYSTSKQQEYTDPKSDMRMFHVVFVMNPPVVEYPLRIEEMYQSILSKFVRTLRYEQARSNYVWKEVSKILEVRDTAAQEGMLNCSEFFLLTLG